MLPKWHMQQGDYYAKAAWNWEGFKNMHIINCLQFDIYVRHKGRTIRLQEGSRKFL